MKKVIVIGVLFVIFTSCQNQKKEVKNIKNQNTIAEQVSALSKTLNQNIQEKYVINLNHHQMAKEEGVYTPPSIATIFSDPNVNTALIKKNALIGIDLPYKILCYTEADTSRVSLTYTSADFIAKRHGLHAKELEDYQKHMRKLLEPIKGVNISETKTDSVDVGYGIISIKSDFDFNQTVQNLKAIVEAQNDTRWFGDIDFQKDAKALGVEIQPATLLLFGGPAPGGKAMMTMPKIGLDAFCQKLLVYKKDNGEIWIAFNDIVAFAKLYYGSFTKPQAMINQRLKVTFTKAVLKQ
ncbi:DUF302 domain-containing protein [Algibacter mikhailovii]|uniref:DUF302 domain-containing protein n=1 Tax=Algibacter mikhailovii TaxID=425498 RepID=A0A918R8U8_9FLAO|nr:DUF302 domain-containing protein [Algibacter mikhailovii]GGZ89863.1 hypothetical protein GCM10007028_30210 [Algibacter mikhailovii]